MVFKIRWERMNSLGKYKRVFLAMLLCSVVCPHCPVVQKITFGEQSWCCKCVRAYVCACITHVHTEGLIVGDSLLE